jgi:hypothetical protein
LGPAQVEPIVTSQLGRDFKEEERSQQFVRFIEAPETPQAPAGEICDDSARDIVFWDVNQSLSAPPLPISSPSSKPPLSPMILSSSPVLIEDEKKGTSFDLDWLCTTSLPFFRLKYLKNTLNENKPVKIARDGTEVDSGTAREILKLWQLDQLN